MDVDSGLSEVVLDALPCNLLHLKLPRTIDVVLLFADVDFHLMDAELKSQVDHLVSEGVCLFSRLKNMFSLQKTFKRTHTTTHTEMSRSDKTVQQYRSEIADRYPALELKHLVCCFAFACFLFVSFVVLCCVC